MLIDLTMPLQPSTPVYPGDPPVQVTTANTFAEAGCLDHLLTFGTHSGTHIDAPAHMIEGAAMLDTFGLEHFVGNARRVDLRGHQTDVSAIEAHDIVLLRSGISDTYDSADYYARVPEITDHVVEELVARNVKMVGIDAGSVDTEPFAVHKALLGAGILIIENLVNLDQLPTGAPFTVSALPLRLSVEGAPARVIASV